MQATTKSDPEEMGLYGKLRDSESPRFFSGATDHGYRKKVRRRTFDASMVRAGRKDCLSHARQGIEESMVQERLEIQADQDIIWEIIARTVREADQRLEDGCICGRQVQKKAWSGSRQKVLCRVRRRRRVKSSLARSAFVRKSDSPTVSRISKRPMLRQHVLWLSTGTRRRVSRSRSCR